MIRIGAIAAIVGGALLIWSGMRDDFSTPVTDCLSQSYNADRVLRIKMLRIMSETEYSNDEKQAEWHLERSREIINESFRPYIDAVAEAIVDDQLSELADSLE